MVSAGLLAVAAGVGVEAATPPPAGVEVAVAATDLPAGHMITASDIGAASMPDASVPRGLVADGDLVGRHLSGPVRAGEPLTDRRVAVDEPAAGLPAGRVAMPVDVRAAASRWLTPGVRISLLASRDDAGAFASTGAGPALAQLVARDVVVLDVPVPADPGLMAAAPVEGTTTVLVSVRETEAPRLAAAGGGWWLSPVLLP